MTDPIAILHTAFASALIAHGHAPLPAHLEAEELTLQVLEQLNGAKTDLGHLLLRVHIYHLRTRGLDPATICKRLGVNRCYVHKAYKKELIRRRYAA